MGTEYYCEYYIFRILNQTKFLREKVFAEQKFPKVAKVLCGRVLSLKKVPKFCNGPQRPSKAKIVFRVISFTFLCLCQFADAPTIHFPEKFLQVQFDVSWKVQLQGHQLMKFAENTHNRENILVSFIFILNDLIPHFPLINYKLRKNIFSPDQSWCCFVKKTFRHLAFGTFPGYLLYPECFFLLVHRRCGQLLNRFSSLQQSLI